MFINREEVKAYRGEARQCYDGRERMAEELRVSELQSEEIESRVNDEIEELKRFADVEAAKRDKAAMEIIESTRQEAMRELENANAVLLNLRNDAVMQSQQEFSRKFEEAVTEERRKAEEAIRIERQNSANLQKTIDDYQNREARFQGTLELIANNYRQEIATFRQQQEATE